jgi:hypothetical protein
VTSRADLKAPFHRFIEVADVQCRHCYYLLTPMIALVIAMRLGFSDGTPHAVVGLGEAPRPLRIK